MHRTFLSRGQGCWLTKLRNKCSTVEEEQSMGLWSTRHTTHKRRRWWVYLLFWIWAKGFQLLFEEDNQPMFGTFMEDSWWQEALTPSLSLSLCKDFWIPVLLAWVGYSLRLTSWELFKNAVHRKDWPVLFACRNSSLRLPLVCQFYIQSIKVFRTGTDSDLYI